MSNNIYNLLFSKIFTFKGRSSRKKYVYKFFSIILVVIINEFVFDIYENEVNFLSSLYVMISASLVILLCLQYFPLAVRRLHDFNVSGWWMLISFIPFGQLIILWLIFKKGTPGANDYGQEPC